MTNSNHFLEFRATNFKRFNDFKIENMGQFNLIVGDNNVGKSSVLEALMFEKEHVKFLQNLCTVLHKLKHFDELTGWFMLHYLKSNAQKNPDKIGFEVKFKDGADCKTDLYFHTSRGSHQWVDYIINHINNIAAPQFGEDSPNLNGLTNSDVPYIPFQLVYTHQIAHFYSKNIQPFNSRKERFLQDLQIIIPDIRNVEINTVLANQPVILVSRQNTGVDLPLGTYGDGFIKLFRILIEMQIHARKRLMIDEIATGVHFSRMKLFWKTIINSARNNRVQLFATTHSDECIKYFKEALDKESEEIKKEARIIHLEEVNPKTQQVKAYTYKFNEFGHAVDIGNELR